MLKLEDIIDVQVQEPEGEKIVRIVSCEPVGTDSANVFYVDPDDKPGFQMLFCSDGSRLEQNTDRAK